MSQLFKELCRILKIEKLRTTPYESSSNGLVERFHLTLNSILAKNVKENQRDWDEHLQKAVAAYRASRHTSTSFSPNYLIFGAENVMPADLILCNPGVLPDEDNSPVAFVAKQQERFRQAYQITRDRLKVTAQKRKSYYDLGVRVKQFPVGSSVWYYYPRQYLKRSKKWSFVYVGPYKVVKRLSDLTYVIQKSPRDKELVVHVDKLKLCHSLEDDSGGPRV